MRAHIIMRRLAVDGLQQPEVDKVIFRTDFVCVTNPVLSPQCLAIATLIVVSCSLVSYYGTY